MNPELQAQLAAALLVGVGAQERPVDPLANTREFVERYGLTIDGGRFDFRAYQHWIEPYEDNHPEITTMCGAQTGKSAWLMATLLRVMLLKWGGLFGYYFPDLHLPKAFSRRRFAPFVRSSEKLGPLLGADTAKGKGVDAVFQRTLGASTLFFLTTAGKSSTEGLPMQGVAFDEVRRMKRGDIERAMERTSAQRGAVDFKVSTARFPESDIHAWFLSGDQRFFHSACSCPDGVVLSKVFPNCVLDMRTATPSLKNKAAHAFEHAGLPMYGMHEDERARYYDAVYYCPVCGDIIVNPRDGWWEPDKPSNFAHSYQLGQMLTPTFPAGRMLHKIETSEDVQELYNSGAGLPYLDPEKQPVKPHHLAACVRSDIHWARKKSKRWRERNVVNTALGMDVQAGYNVVVIKQFAPNGKHRTVHLEVVHDPETQDPWKLTARLMAEFDVRCAVVDWAPHWNEAYRFALAFKGRVYLASYNDADDMVRWGDVGKKPQQKGAETRMKWTVGINRSKGLRWSLGRWVNRVNEVPHPVELIQRLPRQGDKVVLTSNLRIGTPEPTAICKDVYFDHLQRIVFVNEYEGDDEKSRKGLRREVAEHIGIDPHFAHADLYASVALARIGMNRGSS